MKIAEGSLEFEALSLFYKHNDQSCFAKLIVANELKWIGLDPKPSPIQIYISTFLWIVMFVLIMMFRL